MRRVYALSMKRESKSTGSTKSAGLKRTLLKSKKNCAEVRVMTGVGILSASAASINALVMPEKVLRLSHNGVPNDFFAFCYLCPDSHTVSVFVNNLSKLTLYKRFYL